MTTSVLEFTPKYMVRCNFKRIFLKKVFFQLQKPTPLSFFKIDTSNLVGILFNTFKWYGSGHNTEVVITRDIVGIFTIWNF